jgi:acyl-lipid omega-6 desaturase (Delta-12 desaturase)
MSAAPVAAALPTVSPGALPPDGQGSTGAPRSLNSVRAVIPASCYGHSTWRGAAAVTQAALLYLVPLAALAITDRWWAVVVLELLTGLGVAGLFVIGHDASHGALFRSARADRAVARCCMLPSLHAEAAWDLGHNRIHHGFTARQGFDFVWHPVTVDEYRSWGALSRWRHRLEWSWLGAGAYFLRSVWWDKMWHFRADGKRRHDIVRDKVLVATVAAAAVGVSATIGAITGGWPTAIWLPVKLFVVPFLIFGEIIGATVYVHHIAPDIRWWGRREWTQFKGQMEATTVLRTPAVVDRLWLHHIFVHVPHHVDPRIPFSQLQRAADSISAAFPGTVRTARLTPGRYLRTTRACKLYDFETGNWSTYRAARG